MSHAIRFSTFVRDHGPLKRACDCTRTEWELAVKERRFLTVYHSENDWSTPAVGLIGQHGCVNTLCKLVFTRPVPSTTTRIIGLRNSEAAFDLVHSDHT